MARMRVPTLVWCQGGRSPLASVVTAKEVFSSLWGSSLSLLASARQVTEAWVKSVSSTSGSGMRRSPISAATKKSTTAISAKIRRLAMEGLRRLTAGFYSPGATVMPVWSTMPPDLYQVLS